MKGNRAHLAKYGAILAHCRTVLERDGALLAESRVVFVRRCSSEHRDRVVLWEEIGLIWKKMGLFWQKVGFFLLKGRTNRLGVL